MTDEELIVTIQPVYTVPTWTTRIGYCGSQSRAFFREQGWDWFQFLQDGIPASKLLATGNALAAHLVAHARAVEEARDGSQA